MEQRSGALPGPDPPIGDQAGDEGDHDHAGAAVDHRGEGERDFCQKSNHGNRGIQGKDDGEDHCRIPLPSAFLFLPAGAHSLTVIEVYHSATTEYRTKEEKYDRLFFGSLPTKGILMLVGAGPFADVRESVLQRCTRNLNVFGGLIRMGTAHRHHIAGADFTFERYFLIESRLSENDLAKKSSFFFLLFVFYV